MKKIIALIIAIVPILTFGQVPSTNKNYVHTVNYTVPVQDGEQGNVDEENKSESVTYFDGMGRPKQSIGLRQGGDSESVIQHYVYDGVGRQAINYMPYANDPVTTNHYEFVNDALIQTHQFYNTAKYENTTNPYSETKFDRSALSRPIEMAAQGDDWKMSNSHTVKLDYSSNLTDEVKQFSVKYLDVSGEKTELVFDRYYPAYELYKTIVKGVNWVSGQTYEKDHTFEQFKDKSGRLILKRAYNENQAHDRAHDTYYVYDKLGNLTYVIPPLASDQIVVLGEQGFKIASQVNYSWVDLVQVDKAFAKGYNKLLEDYDNADILNADLANTYDGQGGFTVTTHDNSELVTLSITFSANQDLALKLGEIASLKEYGKFKDTELGHLKTANYDYLFLIKNNTIIVEGYGKLSSINQTFSSNTKLDYTENYSWTQFYEVDPFFAANYESQIKNYPNSEILDVVIPNTHNGTGGLNISIDENDIIAVNINVSSSTPFKLKQGLVLPLNAGRSMADRLLGSISGTGYNYTFEIKENYLYITGQGELTNISTFFYQPPPPPPPTVDSEAIAGLCYIYHYDSRNRMIEAKVPGRGWEHVVYDKLNRPILTQNAKQRIDNEWVFIKYDKFGRTAYSGTYTYTPYGYGGDDNSGRLELQQLVNSQTNPVWFETKQTTTSNLNIVYSNDVYPNVVVNMEVLTINYYDDYEGFNVPEIQLATGSMVFDQVITSNTKSLATASSVKVLNENNQWTHYVTYYDDKARPIYAASKNEFLNTIDVIKNDLDNFNGRLLQTEKSHIKNNNSPIVTVENYSYDHAGRMLTQVQTINNQTPELLVKMTYDELGRVENKKVGGVVATNVEDSNGLQTVDYAFNIRGWLKSINEGNTNNGDVFGFKLSYNNPELTGSTALFNGNISETHFVAASDNKLRSYSYQYDALNRIKEANYVGNYTVEGLTDIEDYSLNHVSYDKNGNILELNRTGLVGVEANTPTGVDLIDQLTYFYAPISNQLAGVNDTASDDGFKDGNTAGDDYLYDINGNMVSDKNKGITTIEYNNIDLPTKIVFHNNDPTNPEAGIIEYVYDAMGTKLKKFKKQSNLSSGAATYYAGNMVYEQSTSTSPITLQFMGNSQGYAEPDGSGGFDYIYQYKDHLGNVRLSYSDFSGDGSIDAGTEIVQAKNYYPFGMDHQYGVGSPMSVINGGRNHKFKFNGQEHDESFGLNVTEMTFRQFDNALGRFHGIDKMASAQHSITPYHFGNNNPIVFNDPSGLLPRAPDFDGFYEAARFSGPVFHWDPYGDRANKSHWSDPYNDGFYSGGSGGGGSGGGSSNSFNGGMSSLAAINAMINITNRSNRGELLFTNRGQGYFHSFEGVVSYGGGEYTNSEFAFFNSMIGTTILDERTVKYRGDYQNAANSVAANIYNTQWYNGSSAWNTTTGLMLYAAETVSKNNANYVYRYGDEFISASQLTKSGKLLNTKWALRFAGAGIITGVIGTGMSYHNIYSDYNKNGNGIKDVNGWDIADATVGTISTVGAIASFVLVANPIGLSVIAIASTAYFTYRLVSQLMED